jgi:hypothetical protein
MCHYDGILVEESIWNSASGVKFVLNLNPVFLCFSLILLIESLSDLFFLWPR